MRAENESVLKPVGLSRFGFGFLDGVPFQTCLLSLWLAGAIGTVAFGGEIHSAVFLGGLAKVRALLQANPALANDAETSSGQTPLHYAVQQKRVEIAKELLKLDADPNVRDKNGNTPLAAAIAWGGLQEAELLLAHGADINEAAERQQERARRKAMWPWNWRLSW